eukprot:CAMPEP_0119005374 /NCGR_PEP_ID=MMETSP1176-20130426/1673_1 /TAXON_ID=265551 /ORGANISM="Synedropsis recta cf, Strain CCMP1620" /LENGTH=303 /DNA_ID=CAMNT_0006957163 /DNA_START=192 /DNA_END=1103 /DNA_ORIENTATION=+
MTTITTRNVVLVICLLGGSMENTSAFQIWGPSRRASQWTSTKRLTTAMFAAADTTGTSSTETAAASKEVKDEASLKFVCDSVYTSEPFPTATPQKILEFFQQPAQRNCMVTAGNQREAEMIETTPNLLEDWRASCRACGATGEPDSSDVVLKVSTGGIKFPGLTLTSNAYVGGKLLEPPTSDSADDYPVYEFLLIKDEQSVTGFKPAVWLFNKLTGADNADGGKKEMPISLTHVTAVQQDGQNMIFQSSTKFTIKVSFPKLLLRLLPVSIEKAEEQGSAAISKALDKDLTNAMKVLREGFLAQ